MAEDGDDRTLLPTEVKLPHDLDAALRSLPPKEREKISLIVYRELGSFRGPYPPPWMLDDYERHRPGFLKELMDRALAAQTNRDTLDQVIVHAQVKYMSRGQLMAFLLSIGCFSLAVVAMWLNYPWIAGLFGMSALTPVVAQFMKNPFAEKPDQVPESRAAGAKNKPKRRNG